MPQIFTISLNGVTYTITLYWCDAGDQGGWVMNIASASGAQIVSGIPLVTGADLLAQYAYKKFGIQIFVQSDDNPDTVPTFTNLGVTSHIYYVSLPS